MMYLYLFIGLAIYRGLISWKFYVAAGRKAWEAFVPFYNVWVLLKITDRPKWWILLYYVPVVDNVMAIILTYELLHVFKFREIKYAILCVLTLGLYLAYLNYTEPLKYHGRDDSWIKKNLGSWVNAVLFAVVAATLIRSTTFESYTIPTGSMEESLMVGDFLFVSKMQYGVRLPMTPLTVPLVHDTIPVLGIPAYTDFIELPYIRLPKINEIQQNDPVVFNYPAQINTQGGRQTANGPTPLEVTVPPVDKKTNFVKRAVAVAGDTLVIDDGQIFINGVKSELPDRAKPQFKYLVEFDPAFYLDPVFMKEEYDIEFAGGSQEMTNQTAGDVRIYPRGVFDEFGIVTTNNFYAIDLTEENAEKLAQHPKVLRLEKLIQRVDSSNYDEVANSRWSLSLFPNLSSHGPAQHVWTRDDYGPLWIPEEGATVDLNLENLSIYRKIIEDYEHHSLEVKDGNIMIDGAVATSYTFAQNYYWMMGDNRHNSHDSRYWGFVPEDHIVGKPVFIWMSLDGYESGFKKLRTDRIFTTVNGSGERVHYFWPFMAVVVIWNVIAHFRKKKKAKAA
ncbi:MAG: signal peptidase I [Bacteroidetes bacterium]|nr:MAG: signal peptidase I [Bacteroidota bacterium]